MKSPSINTEKGWTEITINDNCGFDMFYLTAEILEQEFNIQFTGKLYDFDTVYWDFIFNNACLTLHYNIYMGVSLSN